MARKHACQTGCEKPFVQVAGCVGGKVFLSRWIVLTVDPIELRKRQVKMSPKLLVSPPWRQAFACPDPIPIWRPGGDESREA
jgi:hypothetical protein